ncbi:MAG: acylneuraminate cytidylyltransferase family protein [Eubacteriales bacterium]|nr:acylneuraminate cytidylyltransferase family protein [Eubacteriales bacterium]
MNILFTICGRAGSKGVKNKNIRDFLGYPLPYYTLSVIELYLNKYGTAFNRTDIALSTDSLELITLFQNVNNEVFIINRAENLSGDFVGKLDVIKDCAIRAEQHYQTRYDIVVDLDITSPLRTVEDLKNTIDKKIEMDVDVVFTVTEARRNPYFNMVMKNDTCYTVVIPSNFVSRQQAPQIYDMNASIYAYSSNYIHSSEVKNRRAEIVVMMDTGVLDIDGESDFEFMQVIAKYLYENKPEFSEAYEYIPKIVK